MLSLFLLHIIIYLKNVFKILVKSSSDYEKLFETEIGYDVIIYHGENKMLTVKEIHAHSSILCIRFQYFRSTFYNEWAEKKMENLLSENQILHRKSFLGNVT